MNGFHACLPRALVFCLLALSFAFPPSAGAQPTGCFLAQIPTVTAQAGDTVCLPVLARGIDQVLSIQFNMSWDTAHLEALYVDYGASVLWGFGPVSFNLIQPDRLSISWFDVFGLAQPLADSSELFSLCFRVKGSGPAFCPLYLDTLKLPYFEVVIDEDLQTESFTPAVFAQQIGGVRLDASAGNDLQLRLACAEKATCGLPVGTLSVEAGGGIPPYIYAWSGPGGYSNSGSAALTGLGGGYYNLTVTDQSGASVLGQFRVEPTPVSFYALVEQSTPAHCGMADGCIDLKMYGGEAPYTFAWSAGDSPDEVNCGLPPGPVQVSITGANGCTFIKSFEVANDTLFYLDISKHNIKTCGTLGDAMALPDWPGPVQYLWSTGDTTAQITGLAEGEYWVTVTVPGGCSRIGSTYITNEAVQYWNLVLDRICPDVDTSAGNLLLRFNHSASMNFPVLVAWGDGTTRLIPEKPEGNYLDSLLSIPSGTYSVTVTDSTGCHSSVAANLHCFPPAQVPDDQLGFYIKDEYLTPQYAVDSCAGVFAKNFTDIMALDFTLNWLNPNRLEMKGLKNLLLPGLTPDAFTLDSAAAHLRLQWSAPGGVAVTLPAESLLFEVCFKARQNITNNSLDFTADPNPPRVVDAAGIERNFIGKYGTVIFGLWFPTGPSVCDFAALEPSCATDGRSQVLLETCHPEKPLSVYYYPDVQMVGELGSTVLLDSGTYEVLVMQPGQWSNELLVHIPKALPDLGCVWPGDADHNRAVNHHDLLPLGLAFGATGPVRANATTTWEGQDASGWGQVTAGHHIDFKYLDANGDGFIDAADTLGIVENWGKVINILTDAPFAAPDGGPAAGILPIVSLPSDTLEPGESIALPLNFGDPGMPLDSIYGLSFSISYDPAVVAPNLHFQPSASWLGDPASNLIWLQRNFPQQGRLDVAITRTDGQPVSGSGSIGDMFIVIEDNIFFGPNPGDSSRQTLLFFSGLRAVNLQESNHGLVGPPVELVIQDKSSSIQEAGKDWVDALIVSPNPASDWLHISSPEAGLQEVVLCDVSGVEVLRLGRSTMRSNWSVPLHGLAAGTYFLTVRAASGAVATRKVCLMH